MVRFEELQMGIAESAKKFFEIYNMQVLIEQFTLDRESKFSLTLPGREDQPPYVSATVSFTYDVLQTGETVYDEEALGKSKTEGDPVELNFTVRFPVMLGAPDMGKLQREIQEEFPDAEPIIMVKEILMPNEPMREYELSYVYELETEDAVDEGLLDELFEELRGIMDLVYARTQDYIDMTWYQGEE